ncbi:MAG: twin-arginine translocase subunit TatC [Bdellovibrionaceae bacterium]|nr:twin-arginine translocase subunit TatC [Pseudobdellovibrionaceae bacterium]
MDSKKLSLLDHLTELRQRIIKCLLALLLGFIVSYFFSKDILEIISQPIKSYLTATNGSLIFISPFEKFSSYLWVSLCSGFILSSPFLFYQVWKFISPGLYKKEKKWSLLFVTFSTLLFLAGILFVYFIVYPLSFRFLLQFGGENELPYISLKPYLSFFLKTAIVFGLIFEAPLILFSLLKLNITNVKQLKKARPYVIVFIAFLSAMITPPDIFSMLFMMAPLYILFEASIWISQNFKA